MFIVFIPRYGIRIYHSSIYTLLYIYSIVVFNLPNIIFFGFVFSRHNARYFLKNVLFLTKRNNFLAQSEISPQCRIFVWGKMSSTLLLSCIKSLSVNRNIPQACNLKPITIISSSNSNFNSTQSWRIRRIWKLLPVSRFVGGVYLFCLFVFLSPGLEIVVGLRIVGVYSATSHGTARLGSSTDRSAILKSTLAQAPCCRHAKN